MTTLPLRSRAKSIDANKVAKLIRLLGSDRPGEVVAAAGALKRALATTGKDLHDLAAAVVAGLETTHQPRSHGPAEPCLDNWESMAWYAHAHRYGLSKHHREFVEDLLMGREPADGCIREWHLQELRRIVAQCANRN